MTLDELLAMPSHKRPVRLRVEDAARMMEMTPQMLRAGLQATPPRFPFGTGVEMGRWEFYISTERFLAYMRPDKYKGVV